MPAEEIRAILTAYRQVMQASWPSLHPEMETALSRWAEASEEELRAELAHYVKEASQPATRVRLFWKLGPGFVFGGCNLPFAHDAGFTSPEALVGLDDFDERLPWTRQAAKYREDDADVFYAGKPKLDIVERQRQSEGTIWVRAGKAPIRSPDGEILGIFGMYEILDSEVGRKLFAERIVAR
jgi:hypothetical protein